MAVTADPDANRSNSLRVLADLPDGGFWKRPGQSAIALGARDGVPLSRASCSKTSDSVVFARQKRPVALLVEEEAQVVTEPLLVALTVPWLLQLEV